VAGLAGLCAVFQPEEKGKTDHEPSCNAASSGPFTVNDIASQFRRSKNLEKNVGEVVASLARLGHPATKDGKSFEIRRVA
jgi:hypothetical protein